MTPTQPLDIGKLKELCEAVGNCRMIADTHHARWNGGREHGFLRAEGELVPVASFVLGVEGMPQDIGRARLALAAEAMNAAQSLILMAERVERLEHKLRMIVSHATGGGSTDTEASVNDICVRISQHHNRVFQGGKDAAARNALSPTEDQHG